MSYQLFVFDFDGTLADSRASIANSVNHALQTKGFAQIPNKAIFPTIGKVPIQQVFTQHHPELQEQDIAELIQLFRNYLTDNAANELTLFPGVRQTLEELHAQHKYLSILTTKHTSVINKVASSLEIASLFSVIYGSGLPGGNKPEKGCMEYIWRQIGSDITPDQTVMIGDTSVDLETATNSGVDSIGVTYGIDGKAIKGTGFTHTIDTFNELLEF